MNNLSGAFLVVLVLSVGGNVWQYEEYNRALMDAVQTGQQNEEEVIRTFDSSSDATIDSGIKRMLGAAGEASNLWLVCTDTCRCEYGSLEEEDPRTYFSRQED